MGVRAAALVIALAAAAGRVVGAPPPAPRAVTALADVPSAIVQIVSLRARTAGARTRHGSAFYVSAQGHLLTCFHVLDRMPREDAPRLRRSDGREQRFEVVGVDRETDLALLRSDPPETFLLLGDEPRPAVGARVIFAGVAARAEDTADAPTVSFQRCAVAALETRRAPRSRRAVANVKLDHIAEPGISGGPLLAEGTLVVVGVMRANLERTTGGIAGERPTGHGLAVPLLYVRSFLQELLAEEPASRLYR